MLWSMNSLVSDGRERYVNANRAALEERLEQRLTEVRARSAYEEATGPLRRALLRVQMWRELRDARREVHGDENLYVTATRPKAG